MGNPRALKIDGLEIEMAWRQVGANPFLAPMLSLHREEAYEQS